MMIRGLLLGLVASVICLALTGVGEASVPRAFVSINGDDNNPCSAVQPCRSFNRALTVVQAGGEIVVQNSGGYSTGFTINQSVTIDAAGFNASVISISGTDLCTINTGASDRVVLRGISFHGASVGTNAINAIQVGSLYVEHCSIAEFFGDGVVMPNGGNLWVTDTDVRACIAGLDVETSGATAANLVAQHSRFTECSNGALLATRGPGTATGCISNCTASLCTTLGFAVFSAGAGNGDLTLTNCRALGNGGSGLSAITASFGNTIMRIANCVVTDNVVGISTLEPPPFSGGTATILGTSPGTNFIWGNGADGAANITETLQ
jgi:hypothetical protein